MSNIIQEEIEKIRKMMLLEDLVQEGGVKKLKQTLDILKKKKKVLLLSCSNRYNWDDKNIDVPKSKLIAMYLNEELGDKSVFIDVSELKIFPCEGNVSNHEGNGCGVKEALLKEDKKNPDKFIRCWASINNPTDEMHKVANSINNADIVIFFGSIRWGKMNAIYTQLIERLTWLENRHTTLGESNLLKDKEAGVIAVGHNWNGKESVKLEKDVLGFFGFQTPDPLFIGWQYTRDSNEESPEAYRNAPDTFEQSWNMKLFRWEKKKGTELSTDKKPNESKFLVFKDFLNEIKNL
jgi:multimeric flavodoxin WrbA